MTDQPKAVATTHKNHYVPIWYQKGFIRGSRGTLHYLDTDPPTRVRPDGQTIVARTPRLLPPKPCFRQMDLYTTWFGDTGVDLVERFLFGPIDDRGAVAVRAFATGDARGMHKNFLAFFEYLDAQKLRTPKGLDWIRAQYPRLGQQELMVEMQNLRQMHCTMWVECVREVVSAESSDVKFIVTDHPVTVYNPACRPDSDVCRYPHDPATGLKGSQTVFALDADHCLVLTNLEYARDPSGVDPLVRRQNARYAGDTITHATPMIRTRTLTRDEVVSVNQLLKARSHRYLAAYSEAWLFPESEGTVACGDIGRVLLPPTDRLWEFGGEILVGFDDGSSQYRDEFGRKGRAHQLLEKGALAGAPLPTDPCPCGSGYRYRRCCSGRLAEERPPWGVQSIRERNLALCRAVADILGLNKGASWEDVRRDLSDDAVRRIHEMLELLWPEGTDVADLLPRPDRRVFRAVHMGFVDPRTVPACVIAPLAYFDEIVLVNPFPHPAHMVAEHSPTQSPTRHRSQLLKNAYLLLMLEPFIDAGIVHLVPDLSEMHADFRRAVTELAKQRTADTHPRPEEMQLGAALMEDDSRRALLRLPDDQLRRTVSSISPDLTPALLDDVVAAMKRELMDDPLALLEPLPQGKREGEVVARRSVTLEFALYVAQLMGAAVYTNELWCWRQLHEHAASASGAGHGCRLAPLAEALHARSFPADADAKINLEIRRSGRLARMRRVFRATFNVACSQSVDADSPDTALTDALHRAGVRSDAEWAACRAAAESPTALALRMELSAPPAGFGLQGVHRFLARSGRTSYAGSVPMGLLLS